MKYRILLLLTLSMTLIACKSKEEKAAELIRERLSQTLLDFNSYEPIETVVTEAHETPYNNAACFQIALTAADHMKKAAQYAEEMSNAKDHMEIWGAPTYYSSSYSDSQYYKYKAQVVENFEKSQEEFSLFQTLGRALQDSIKILSPEKIIGWEVKHRFRCKTRGGHPAIADYRYVIDADFNNILFYEDMDEDDSSRARAIIGMAETNEFDEELLDD